MSSNFYCSYMEMSSLITYILGFSVKFFFQTIYTDYANQAYFDKRSHLNLLLKPLNQIKANLAGMVLGWSPFNIVSDSHALHSKWLLLLKIEISLVVNFCFTTNQNELKNFNCSYMAMSNLTYILGFSVRFFQPVQEYYEIQITSKSFAQK